MEFGSVIFLLRFLPIFFIAYFLVPGRGKNMVLLLGSLCFYAWGKPLYLLPMVICTISDYVHGLLIDRHRGSSTAKILLSSALFFDLTLLFFFGYADFFIDTIDLLWNLKWMKFGFSMPVGITIYTLHSMSYVIDVYQGKYRAEKNLLNYGTYVTMFPVIPAGPILRYSDVREDLRSRKPDLGQISYGAKRICVGLAKKILIADVMGRLWESVLEMRPMGTSTASAWLGLLACAFHVYYSFSGYADIAIGLGACMGFRFPENFDHPYVARSIEDFVNRWNVTLTNWMKDYFYQNVAGNKKDVSQKTLWTLITWGLIGLWYGPDWSFVLWGIWLGVFYILEKLFLGKLLAVLPRVFGWCLVMLVISVGWLFLALNELTDVWAYFLTLFGAGGRGLMDRRFFTLVMEYYPTIALGFLFSVPLLSGVLKRLETGRGGLAIALTRLLEKIYPPICLLASLTYLIGRGW